MKIILFFFAFSHILLNGQNFTDYRERYDNFEENDLRAFRFLNPYIEKAKEKRNYVELTQAYKDATSFSQENKLQYADSMIWAAAQSKNRDLIGASYLTKGTIYYFNYKKFKLALDEYLKAWTYLQGSEDEYLHYKNLYHIAIVKSYLGYYEEALRLFEKCRMHYENENNHPNPPNLSYNNKKGYLNSLHQNIACLIELDRLKEASSLLNKGLQHTTGDMDFYIERSYFYKLQGMIDYKNKNYDSAILNFNNALAGVEKKNDFTNASTIYFYKGKSLLSKGETNKAISYFIKVDSIFKKHMFILPEVRENYEILINYSKITGKDKMELYYTSQLLKVDRILSTDFKYLSEKIHKEYDTKDLLEAKRRLETSSTNANRTAAILFFLLLLLFLILYLKWQKEKRVQAKYNDLLVKIREEENQKPIDTLNDNPKNSKLNEEKANEILSRLSVLEEENFFIDKSMNLNKLARKLKTNTAYLSEIINDYKGCHFSVYLNQLRIQFITRKLYQNKSWRNYSLKALSEECGFRNTTIFSKDFLEFNGLSIMEFIRKRNEDQNEDL